MEGMFGPAMAGCGKASLIGLVNLAVNRVLEANFNSWMLTAPQVWQYTMGQRYAIAFITGTTPPHPPYSAAVSCSYRVRENAQCTAHVSDLSAPLRCVNGVMRHTAPTTRCMLRLVWLYTS